MTPTFQYENPYRTIYEAYSALGWLVAAALMTMSAFVVPYPNVPFLIFGGVCVGMAAYRGAGGWRLWERQKRLAGAPLTFMTRAELFELCRSRPDHVFIGFGFPWSQAEAQLTHTLTRHDPELLAPRQAGSMGQPWVHGLGEKEEPLFVPIDHLKGQTLVSGTTGAGKTRLMDSFIAQDVFRGDCVIILDPKGDRDLCESARLACIDAGREEDWVYFHPAFPDKSVRIDPMKNFNRPTELAARVAALIPSETGSDPFTAFSLMAMTNIIQGLLIINEKPSLALLRRNLESGPATLVCAAIDAYSEKTFDTDEWRVHLKRCLGEIKGAPNDKKRAAAYVDFYRDYVVKRHPSSELDGLISSFEHDAVHFGKMVTSLMPVLTMLTTGSLGGLLSPDPSDLRDPRPITDFARIIRMKQVCYIGLDSLSDVFVGSAIGSMFLSDLTAVSGDTYNYAETITPVNLYVDEASELANGPFIALLNKSRGSGVRVTAASQVVLSDFASRLGSESRARMALGNLNNVFALRAIEPETQEFITDCMGETVVRHVEYGQSTKAETDEPLVFSGTTSESLKETTVPLVGAPMMGCLPNLEFFARVSAGRVLKARIPILKTR
jgi:conjugal transfer pilus assembly protein TraD